MRCKKCRKEMQRVRFKDENIFYYHCHSCGYDVGKPTRSEKEVVEEVKEESEKTDG